MVSFLRWLQAMSRSFRLICYLRCTCQVRQEEPGPHFLWNNITPPSKGTVMIYKMKSWDPGMVETAQAQELKSLFGTELAEPTFHHLLRCLVCPWISILKALWHGWGPWCFVTPEGSLWHFARPSRWVPGCGGGEDYGFNTPTCLSPCKSEATPLISLASSPPSS